MPLSADDLRRMLVEAGGLVRTLHHADRRLRAQLYERLQIEGLYQPAERVVVVTADLVCGRLVSEGDLNPHVLADTRPSTSPRPFHRLFFNGS